MRQRKAKDMEARLARCAEWIIVDPIPEAWDTCFSAGGRDAGSRSGRDLYLEIGCGKGQFIIQKALTEPGNDFIAIEGQETVILRALEKTAAACGCEIKNDKIAVSDVKREIPNLKFACIFVDDMAQHFHEGQLAGIYLNFSDPWPKARHAKRRLTYHERLLDYAWALKDGGFIEIKTDNDGLFEFTLEQIREVNEMPETKSSDDGRNITLEIAEMSRDLHGSDYESKNFMTEYEEKFKGTGKNINYVKIIIRK